MPSCQEDLGVVSGPHTECIMPSSLGSGRRSVLRHTGSGLRRVTAVSHIRGIRGMRKDTRGYDDRRHWVRVDTRGSARIRKDTPPRRFGTVRPRVQVPGPRPAFELRIGNFGVAVELVGSQTDHRFAEKVAATAGLRSRRQRYLNSHIFIGRRWTRDMHSHVKARTVHRISLKSKQAHAVGSLLSSPPS